MMNKILTDLINEKKVTTFVNDVLVRTETEKRHDEIVKKVLRRLKKNDLYVKPEKLTTEYRKDVPEQREKKRLN